MNCAASRRGFYLASPSVTTPESPQQRGRRKFGGRNSETRVEGQRIWSAMTAYMEDLRGFLLEEQKPVTYSYLSSTLSVPADTAKR